MGSGFVGTRTVSATVSGGGGRGLERQPRDRSRRCQAPVFMSAYRCAMMRVSFVGLGLWCDIFVGVSIEARRPSDGSPEEPLEGWDWREQRRAKHYAAAGSRAAGPGSRQLGGRACVLTLDAARGGIIGRLAAHHQLRGDLLTLTVVGRTENAEIEAALAQGVSSAGPGARLRLLWDASRSDTPAQRGGRRLSAWASSPRSPPGRSSSGPRSSSMAPASRRCSTSSDRRGRGRCPSCPWPRSWTRPRR